MEKRTCIECGEAFNGRSDKKFCSDMCRNAYNNKLNSDTNNYVRNVNNALRKNRRILESLIPKETMIVTKQKLVAEGFDFKYYTNTLNTKKGHYFFCYEYGYLPIDDNSYLLVKGKELD